MSNQPHTPQDARFSAGRPAEWIETLVPAANPREARVSPLEDQRSGLKHRRKLRRLGHRRVSPLEDQRSGLKLWFLGTLPCGWVVSPLEDQRSGLKPKRAGVAYGRYPFLR